MRIGFKVLCFGMLEGYITDIELNDFGEPFIVTVRYVHGETDRFTTFNQIKILSEAVH